MLPQNLIDDGLFCMWKRETKPDGTTTKVLYDPHTGLRGDSRDPDKFTDYEEASWMSKALDMNGIGIYVGRGFSAIDIDHCISDDGTVSDLAEDIITTMNSYTETSPSGTGIRIIFKTPESYKYDADKYYLKNPSNHVEVYVSGATSRFVTVTGNHVDDTPNLAESREMELNKILTNYMLRPKKSNKSKNKPTQRRFKLSDEQIISKASSSDERFRLLFQGDLTYYNNDASSADMALCNKLAFWTGCDPVQMDSIFRKSGLFREKWLRQDYSSRTIQNAVDSCDTTYNPESYDSDIFQKLGTPTYRIGDYTITSDGITLNSEKTSVLVTTTPILPTMHIENLDTGIHRTELSYIVNNTQRTVIYDNEIISSKSKITVLANDGIAVTTTTSKLLVDFLAYVSDHNDIPHTSAVSRLGWSGNKFLPYDSDIKFDGATSDRKLFGSITSSGSFPDYIRYISELRKNLPLRLCMAASFASPLIEKLSTLPFVCHLWGGTGTGKTVALLVAMSVWGKPTLGELVYTMDMTDNAMTHTAGFLHSIPFAGDELQLIKSNFGYDKLIMKCTEGVERGRMHFSDKQNQLTWRNSFIFTGEEPCTSESSGGGTKNRVIEIKVTSPVVSRGTDVVRFINHNYGHAGEVFIDYIKNYDVQPIYDGYFDELTKLNTTDKQASAMALMLTADYLAVESIFSDEQSIRIDDVIDYLKMNDEVQTSTRSEEFIRQWVWQNQQNFTIDARPMYGIIQGDDVYISTKAVRDALQEGGFSLEAVREGWVESGFLEELTSRTKKINGMVVRCYHLTLGNSGNS